MKKIFLRKEYNKNKKLFMDILFLSNYLKKEEIQILYSKEEIIRDSVRKVNFIVLNKNEKDKKYNINYLKLISNNRSETLYPKDLIKENINTIYELIKSHEKHYDKFLKFSITNEEIELYELDKSKFKNLSIKIDDYVQNNNNELLQNIINMFDKYVSNGKNLKNSKNIVFEYQGVNL